MQPSNNGPPLCARCEKNPGTEKYHLSQDTEMICAACLEQETLRAQFQQDMYHFFELERSRQYDEALAFLDRLLEANRNRDHDGWLARSIAHSRAIAIFRAGRYAEAEHAYNEWARLGFADGYERWMHALGKAETLEALGRDQEAVALLQEALGYEDPKSLPSVLSVLIELVRFSEKVGQAFDSKWLKIAEAVAERYGVDMPVRDSPGQAVLALEQAVRGKQPKRPDEW